MNCRRLPVALSQAPPPRSPRQSLPRSPSPSSAACDTARANTTPADRTCELRRRAACRKLPAPARHAAPASEMPARTSPASPSTWRTQKCESSPDGRPARRPLLDPPGRSSPCFADASISSRISVSMRSESNTWSSAETGHRIRRVVPEHLAVAVVPRIEPIIELRGQLRRQRPRVLAAALTSSESSNRHPSRSARSWANSPPREPYSRSTVITRSAHAS